MEKKKVADYNSFKGDVLWCKKIRTMFRRFDTRGHGFLNLSDFLNAAAAIIESLKNCDSYKGDHIVSAMVFMWYKVLAVHVDEKQKTTAIVNETQFIENLKAASLENGEWKKNFSEHVIGIFFAAGDEDDSGKITALQFKNILKAWRTPDTSLDMIFKLADADKDGKITRDEYEYIMADFFFSEDSKSKVSTLWGRLVSYKRPEDFGTLQFGPCWESKMHTIFRRFDVGSASKLRCHDFIQIARGIAQRGRMDKKRANNVLTALLNVWVRWIGIDKDGRPIDEINEKEFVHNLRVLINGNCRHEIDQFGWTFFKAMEMEGTGFVSMQEYSYLQEAWGVGKEEAEAMFKILDLDKDKKLSSDEYLNGWVDYFVGEDPASPYMGFFGPIIATCGAH